jgi:hypothetical protein
VALAALPRRREEYLKILRLEHPSRALFELYDLGLIEVCLPSLMPMFESVDGRMLLSYYLDSFLKEQIKMSPNPVHLMAPLVLAMLHFSNSEDWDRIEHFLKNEFGAFRSEISILQAALAGRYSLPKIENFKKRSRKRKKGFIQNPWFYLQYEALTFDYDLSAKQRILWEREIELATQLSDADSGSLKSEDQSDQDPKHDLPHPAQ